MKELGKVWWGVCYSLLGVANMMLFIYMMFMFGFWGRMTVWPLFYLLNLGFAFSYYAAAPVAIFGFLCALGCSMRHQTQRAALLAALSGGALFSAILVWGFLHL